MTQKAKPLVFILKKDDQGEAIWKTPRFRKKKKKADVKLSFQTDTEVVKTERRTICSNVNLNQIILVLINLRGLEEQSSFCPPLSHLLESCYSKLKALVVGVDPYNITVRW